MSDNIPKLSGDALEARNSDAEHIQIIAGAGSGKTETISQRVARLVSEGVDSSKIVAFTFTIKAAEELRERIRVRVAALAGQSAADKLGSLYVGTIHGYCMQLLQTHIGIYESYEMIDENQLAAFAIRWNSRLQLSRFDTSGKNGIYAGMTDFLENVQVLENELLPLNEVDAEFAEAVKLLYELLDQHRLMTFGMQIDRAIAELEKLEVKELISGKIEHLIVDEYQDINPSQERLIQLLAKPLGEANLVVVGDDDQAIYQWRGSSVSNITTFTSRYPAVKTFELLANRRSRPAIVRLANEFAQTIPGRIHKSMQPTREHNGPSVDIIENHEFEIEEVTDIAQSINRLVQNGYSYSDMAILVRARASYPRLLEALEQHGIPVSPGDRVGLFQQPDADFLGRVFAWLAGREWKISRYGDSEGEVTLDMLKEKFEPLYSADWKPVEELLLAQKAKVGTDSRKISLVNFCYSLLKALGVEEWDAQFIVFTSRLGTIARFLKLVADYEGMRMHSRVNEDGTQTGAGDYGVYYFQDFAGLISNYALDKYRDFEGEPDFETDSVDLLTIHTAKGLEWPIVFVPSLTKRRFHQTKLVKEKRG